MIVVADTTPLNYLILISEVEVLPALYSEVLVPFEVHRELLNPRSPSPVRDWVFNIPSWCKVCHLKSRPDASLSELDAGERDAIQLALDSGIDTILIDEIDGRREAIRRSLKVTGTVGILEKASQRGIVDFRAALRRLDQTSFRLSDSLREEFLRRNP